MDRPSNQSAATGLPGSRARAVWRALALLLLAASVVAGALLWYEAGHRQIATRGGLWFQITLPVPGFRQGDPRWHNDPLGNTDGTLGGEGCAVASAAMVLSSYGVDTDPQRLNRYLTGHGGYVGAGWLVWEKAAKLAGGGLEKAYEDLPSYWEIDRQLLGRNPVIVRIRFPSGTTHFVVIAGKRGFDYLIHDPGAGWPKGLYPLRELTDHIEALRYYRRTGLPVSTLPESKIGVSAGTSGTDTASTTGSAATSGT